MINRRAGVHDAAGRQFRARIHDAACKNNDTGSKPCVWAYGGLGVHYEGQLKAGRSCACQEIESQLGIAHRG
jgi:hypothetical protein